MVKNVISVTLLFLVFSGFSQVKRQFLVEKSKQCNRVDLYIKAKTGNCIVRPTSNHDFLNIYSDQDLEKYTYSLTNEIINQTNFINLALEEENYSGIAQRLTYHVFGRENKMSDKFWEIHLSEHTPYGIYLEYGIGNANIDLSGMAIEKLKVTTVSADVNISYLSGIENKTRMDTLYARVDMGSLIVNQINLCKSKVIVADVGFGNMYLDFSKNTTTTNYVMGSVGAGNLIIMLPTDEIPVLININDSWLCSITLSKSLRKVAENKFANTYYTLNNSKNAIVFNLDVSMGNIIFRESK